MADLFVVALMWALIATLIIVRRAFKERSALYAAIIIAVAMMLNDDMEDGTYAMIDGWVGSQDIAHLISVLALTAGIYVMTRASGNKFLSGKPAASLLVATLVVTTISFFLIPGRDGSSASFMYMHGDHPAGAVYSSTQFVYFVIVFTALSATSIATVRHAAVARERVAGSLLFAGCIGTIALSVNVISMDIAQLAGGVSAAEPWEPSLPVLKVGTFLALTAGLAAAPIGRWIGQIRRERSIDAYLTRITPLWEDAVRARPSAGLDTPSNDSEYRLHRRVVEIRDAAMDRRNAFTLRDEDKTLLAEAENQLVAGRVRPPASSLRVV